MNLAHRIPRRLLAGGWPRSPGGDPRRGARSDGGTRRDARLLLLVLGILLLSALDGIFTLLLVGTGSVEEWNPLLAPLVENDPTLFARAKMSVTALGLFVLAALVDRRIFRWLRVETALHWIFALYVLLLAYHLTLTFHVTGG